MVIGVAFEDVLAAAQAGEEWGFAALYRDLNPALLRYFSARASGAGEDLAADTWLAAARRLSAFSGDEGAFRAWMFTIAYRRLVQHWRDSGRTPARVVEDLDGRAAADDTEAEALEATAAREAAVAIARSLPPDQADVVLLRVLGGLDVGQVAEVLDKRPGAVRALQHRALRRLARAYSMDGVTR